MKNKEGLKIKLLTEKLEKLSGKKVVLEEGKYTKALLDSGVNFDTDIEHVSADHADISGLAESFSAALNKNGLYCYEDPTFDGSDSYGFIISKKPLAKKQINWAAKAIFEESKTSKKKVIKEGIWALPKDMKDYITAKNMLFEIENLKSRISKVLGDDDLLDGLDSALRRGKELLKLAVEQNPSINRE